MQKKTTTQKVIAAKNRKDDEQKEDNLEKDSGKFLMKHLSGAYTCINVLIIIARSFENMCTVT